LFVFFAPWRLGAKKALLQVLRGLHGGNDQPTDAPERVPPIGPRIVLLGDCGHADGNKPVGGQGKPDGEVES